MRYTPSAQLFLWGLFMTGLCMITRLIEAL
jgi:hypothetical protein